MKTFIKITISEWCLKVMCPQQELHLCLGFRRALFYLLNYEGSKKLFWASQLRREKFK